MAEGRDAARRRSRLIWLAGLGLAVALAAALAGSGLARTTPWVLVLAVLPLLAAAWVHQEMFPPGRPAAPPAPPAPAPAPVPASPAAKPVPPPPAPAPVPAPMPASAPPASTPPALAQETPEALLARLLARATRDPASEAERREIAIRLAHDPRFATPAQAAGLDEVGTRALLLCLKERRLAGDLMGCARRIAAARRAALLADPRREALHARLLAHDPALAAEFLEALTLAPDLDPERVAEGLLRRVAPPMPLARLDERRLAEALEVLSALGPVTALVNPDGSVTLTPARTPTRPARPPAPPIPPPPPSPPPPVAGPTIPPAG